MKRFGIETSLVDPRETYTVKDKRDYNHLNCVLVDSLLRYFTTCFKILILDHLDLGTTTALHEILNLPLRALDLVSKSVSFKTKTPHKFGILYTGELASFVKEFGDLRVYDAMILDFCCAWDDKVEKLLRIILEKRMLCNMAVVSFTFSYRKACEHYKQNKLDAKSGIYKLFDEYGYQLDWCGEHEDGTMFSLFGKCIYKVEAMSSRMPKLACGDASNWLAIHPSIHQSFQKRSKKNAGWECSKGHVLKSGKSPLAGCYAKWESWSCDNCDEVFDLSVKHMRCDKCCYDLCENCY